MSTSRPIRIVHIQNVFYVVCIYSLPITLICLIFDVTHYFSSKILRKKFQNSIQQTLFFSLLYVCCCIVYLYLYKRFLKFLANYTPSVNVPSHGSATALCTVYTPFSYHGRSCSYLFIDYKLLSKFHSSVARERNTTSLI